MERGYQEVTVLSLLVATDRVGQEPVEELEDFRALGQRTPRTATQPRQIRSRTFPACECLKSPHELRNRSRRLRR